MSTPPRPRRAVGVSLKMYFTHAQTMSYLDALLSSRPATTPSSAEIDLFLIPSFLSLAHASALLAALSASPAAAHPQLGAQDCHAVDAGAFTGETSPRALAQLGVRLVELGHAERRALSGETDELVARKAAAVLRNDMVPLVCVGERERGDADAAVEAVWTQMRELVQLLPETTQEDQDKDQSPLGQRTELIFAYEPVWAIGQSEPAPAAHVVAVTRRLRERCAHRPVRILYGGSAGPGTWDAMRDGVDGLFLGRFAHDPARFWEVVDEVAG